MKKKDIFVNGSAAYEQPQINIFTFEVEGVLCGSIDDGQGGGVPGPEDPEYGEDIEGWG